MDEITAILATLINGMNAIMKLIFQPTFYDKLIDIDALYLNTFIWIS